MHSSSPLHILAASARLNPCAATDRERVGAPGGDRSIDWRGGRCVPPRRDGPSVSTGMIRRTLSTAALGALLLASLAAAAAEGPPGAAAQNWPRWRGPEGTGHSPDADAPVKWDASSVVWKTPLKGRGQSSPIVWGDRVFLTSAVDDGRQRLVICVDPRDGRVAGEQVAWTGEPEPTHEMNGWASASCCTDGERVYASFGRGGMHCYTMDGKH